MNWARAPIRNSSPIPRSSGSSNEDSEYLERACAQSAVVWRQILALRNVAKKPLDAPCSHLFRICSSRATLKVEGHPVGTARNRVAHKHFRLDTAKIKRAQRLLRTGTETETI